MALVEFTSGNRGSVGIDCEKKLPPSHCTNRDIENRGYSTRRGCEFAEVSLYLSVLCGVVLCRLKALCTSGAVLGYIF